LDETLTTIRETQRDVNTNGYPSEEDNILEGHQNFEGWDVDLKYRTGSVQENLK